MKTRHLLLSLLLACVAIGSTPAAAQPALPPPCATATFRMLPPDVSYSVQLALDPTGAVVAVDSHDAVPDSLRTIVERAAGRARFSPATRDGRPVPARVWVTVRVAFAADGDRVRASVRSVVAGGGIDWGALPHHMPMRTRARGYSAVAQVTAIIGADGEVQTLRSKIHSVAIYRDPDGRDFELLEDGLRRAFRTVTRRSMHNWRWTPDEVDGQPVGGVFEMAVAFPSPRAQRDTRLAPNPLPDLRFNPVAADGLQPARMRTTGAEVEVDAAPTASRPSS